MKPPTSGSKPACTLRLPEADSAASVRPWKLRSMTTIDGRSMPRAWPTRRVILIAHSMVSAPELATNTRSMPVMSARRSASASCQGTRTTLAVWISRFAWSAIASATRGCAWPSPQTAMPARASR